jgi:hypothetical protein
MFQFDEQFYRSIIAGGPLKRGRNSLFTKAELTNIKNDINNRTTDCKSVEKFQIVKYLRQKLKDKKRMGLCTKESLSTKTALRIKKILELRKISSGDIKSIARQEAYENVRNPLSLCAVLSALSNVWNRELFFTTDDVHILLNDWGKAELITTAEAIKIMSERHLGVSTTKDTRQRRVVVFNCTISSTDLVCCVIKIIDRNDKFRGYLETPGLFNMTNGLYILLAHSDTCQNKINSLIYKDVIIPLVMQRRRDLRLRDAITSSSTSTSPTKPSGDRSTKSIDMVNSNCVNNIIINNYYNSNSSNRAIINTSNVEDNDTIILACDGALSQVHVIMDTLSQENARMEWNILFVKYAAQCSMIQSPNDVGKMHQILHKKSYPRNTMMKIQ